MLAFVLLLMSGQLEIQDQKVEVNTLVKVRPAGGASPIKQVRYISLTPGLAIVAPEDLKDPTAFIFVATAPGTYTVQALTASGDTVNEPKVFRVIASGKPGPVPPPGPDPGPPPIPPGPGPGPDPSPGPTPVPAPIPLDGLRVLLVYDPKTQTTLPASQNSVLFGADVRGYLNAKTALGKSGFREWRLWPVGTDNTGEADHWQKAMARERKSLPWILISNGKTGYEGPLPGTVEETLKLLKTYGGE